MKNRAIAGFSLIELSIILTVLALTLVAALSWLAPSAREEAQKVERTQQKLEDIRRALYAFRVNYNRLPCPANNTLADGNAALGQEDCQPRFTGINRGIVPVQALGISPEYLYDEWGRRFTYQVATPLCNLSLAGQPLPVNCAPVNYAPTTSTPVGNLTINTTDVFDLTSTRTITTQAAFVVISFGPNGYGAWLPSGVQRTAGTSSTQENTNANLAGTGTIFWTDPYSQRFSNLVVYDTRQVIESRVIDFDRTAFTLAECQTNVSATLGAITRASSDAMNTGTPGPLATNSVFGPTQAPSPSLLGILWQAQDICARYYPYYYTSGALITCPGADVDPGNRRVFNTTVGLTTEPRLNGNIGYCVCNAGAWDAATGQCL